MKKLYTREEMEKIFIELGITKGMTVCLQVNPDYVSNVIGGMQTIIEAMMHLLTKKGCLIVPCFCEDSLDPSCVKENSYENWEIIRQEMIGYKANLSDCDAFATQFLRNIDVQRSKHPISSLAYWGTYRSTVLDCTQDFPLSFENQCALLSKEKARNVLIGYEQGESVLLSAIAKEIKQGTIIVRRAKIRRVKTSIFKVFLDLSLTSEDKEICLEECHEKSYKWEDCNIYNLWVHNNFVKMDAMDSNVSVLSLSK